MKKPLVSIICIAYNHEKYIRQAIEGFLMQKTAFDYEIIIHDDASLDATADIIREYASKYPEKITAILQTENQYSQGKKITVKLIKEVAKGKYIAFCEGDDFWISPNKLQKQVDALSDNPECVACCHNAIVIQKDGVPWDEEKSLVHYEMLDGIHDKSYLVENGRFGQTATLMFERRLLSEMTEKQYKEYCNVKANGDMKWSALIAAKGKVYHIAQDYACYRYVLNEGSSWTSRNRDKNYFYSTYMALENLKRFALEEYGTELDYQIYQDFLARSAIKRLIKTRNDEDRMIMSKLLAENGSTISFIWRTACRVVKKIYGAKHRKKILRRRKEDLEQYRKKICRV